MWVHKQKEYKKQMRCSRCHVTQAKNYYKTVLLCKACYKIVKDIDEMMIKTGKICWEVKCFRSK